MVHALVEIGSQLCLLEWEHLQLIVPSESLFTHADEDFDQVLSMLDHREVVALAREHKPNYDIVSMSSEQMTKLGDPYFQQKLIVIKLM